MIQTLQVVLAKLSLVLISAQIALAAQASGILVYPPDRPSNSEIWANTPLYRVAACESTGDPNGVPRQFKPDGTPLWGNDPNLRGATTTDVGAMQISLKWHKDELDLLRLDVVNSEADNIYYGFLLYKRYGLSPWLASRGCWLR